MRYLLGLLAIMPIGVVTLFNAYKWFSGRGFEPTRDNLAMAVVLFVTLRPAAFACGIRYRFANLVASAPVDFLLYGGVAALGSGALLTIADYTDDYFTPGGVGWGWPLTGSIAGLVFGLLFRLVLSVALLRRFA